MKNLINQIETIDFYFSKVEVYLERKHRNLMNKVSGNMSDCSGSPKSTISDRVQNSQATMEDEFERSGKERSQSRRFEFPADEEDDEEEVKEDG